MGYQRNGCHYRREQACSSFPCSAPSNPLRVALNLRPQCLSQVRWKCIRDGMMRFMTYLYQQWVKMYHPESPCIEFSAPLEPTPANEIEGIRLDHSSDHEISSAFTENSLEPASSTPNSSVNVLPRSSFLSRLLADKAPTLKTTQKGPKGGAESSQVRRT